MTTTSDQNRLDPRELPFRTFCSAAFGYSTIRSDRILILFAMFQ
jgi:hypothetical protein